MGAPLHSHWYVTVAPSGAVTLAASSGMGCPAATITTPDLFSETDGCTPASVAFSVSNVASRTSTRTEEPSTGTFQFSVSAVDQSCSTFRWPFADTSVKRNSLSPCTPPCAVALSGTTVPGSTAPAAESVAESGVYSSSWSSDSVPYVPAMAAFAVSQPLEPAGA